jgi:hypothetical protein
LNILRAGISRIPIVGGVIDPKYEQSKTEIENSVAQMVKGLQETTRLSNAEREDILRDLSVLPRFIDRPEAFQNRLIALDNVIAGIERGAVSRSGEANIGATKRQEAEQKISEVRRIRQMVGIPPRINSTEQWNSAPPGPYLVFDPNSRIYVPAVKR